MIKKISFGKVDGYNIGRRTCEVVLEVGFREFPNQEPYFTVCASLWNNLHTDVIQGGQCIDTLQKEYSSLKSNELYNKIVALWEKYHLKKFSEIPIDDIMKIDKIISE